MKIPLPLHLLIILLLGALGHWFPLCGYAAIGLALLLIVGWLSRDDHSVLRVNNATIKGDSTVLWGTRSGANVAGIIASYRDQLTGEMVEIPDEDGFTVTAIFFNDKHECEVEVIVRTTFPTLARGDLVTIAGITGCLVTETEKMWEQKQVAKFRVKATKFAAI